MSQLATDRRHGVLLVTFGGSLTPESLKAFDSNVKDFVAREGPMPVIVDFTGVVCAGNPPSTAIDRGKEAPRMAAMPRVFVADDPLLFGMLRVYAAYQDISGGRQPAVVRSLAKAFEVLGLTDPNFEPLALRSRQHDAMASAASDTRPD